MLCQATKSLPATVELPSQSPDGPYHLCASAAVRLQHFALRPLEWFNLAAIHGPMEHQLHDDFYTDQGHAIQPHMGIPDSHLFPFPAMESCAKTLPDHLDFALTRWHLKPPVTDAFGPHLSNLPDAIAQRFKQTQNLWFHERLVEIAAHTLEQRAADWFTTILNQSDPIQRLRYLGVGLKCLPHLTGLHRAQESLLQIPPNQIAQWCLVLARFREPAVLDWMEKNIHDPLTSHWGDVAAVSRPDWDRMAKWLNAGRPLSLVALDAMAACSGPRANQSYLIQEMRPRLRANVPAQAIETALADYALRDRSPRTSRAVAFITKNLQRIIESE